MKPSIKRNLSLCLVAAGLLISQLPARAADYHVATAQQLQNALTLTAASSVSNNIYITNGYYAGNFNFNSANVNSLTILAEPGVASSQIVIDSGGTGSSMNISGSATANITVQGMTFLRNGGSGLQIAGGNTAILVNGCSFLSPTNSNGSGLVLGSGLDATVTNCTAAGVTSGGGGTGIYISGITSNVMVLNCLVTTNMAPADEWYVLDGGGIYIDVAGVANLVSNTFVGNSISGYGAGGGVYCVGSATFTGNYFIGNSCSWGSGSGGGVCCEGSATFTGNTFTGNSSPGNWPGGGVYCGGPATLIGNTFTSNSVTGYGGGGGAYCGNLATLSGNTFTGNSDGGGGGGGVYCHFYQGATLYGNTFTGNSEDGGQGGGALCTSWYVSGWTNLPMIISGNTFQNNTAVSGGGFYASGPTITLLDNLVVNNGTTSSAAQGGGIWVDASATLNMINNTITGNTSPGSGGGVAFIVTGTVELLNVYNNIIWGNLATVSGGDVYLSGTGQQKVFEFNDTDSMSGVWDIAQNNIDLSPKFFDPVNGDYHTQSTSPCRNAGTNGAPSLPMADLDGNSRTNSAGLVDMGCYEFNTAATHPADANTNWVITAAEFNAYAAAWKNGQGWTNGPTPISADYVTRAGYLMTNNAGRYTNDGSARPVNWKTKP